MSDASGNPSSGNLFGPRALGALALLPGLSVLVAALIVGGGAAALALGDPSALVRWGLPVARFVQDLSASATIGLLLLAGYLVPETTRTSFRLRALSLARITSITWAASAWFAVVFIFSDTSGVAPSAPGFFQQLLSFIWQLDPVRIATIVALLATAISIGMWRSKTKVGAAIWMPIALLPVALLALSGHSSASSDHMNGVNTFAFHMLGASVWVGGLIALALLWPSLGKHAAVTVRRYSTVAGWCYGLLVFSGLVLTWIDLGSLSKLATIWGAILIGKAALAIGLGFIGAIHRRKIIAKLEEKATGRLFGRLLLVELGLMSLASGLAVALTRTPIPGSDEVPSTTLVEQLTGYPDPGAPSADSWLTAWRIDWLWLPIAVLAVVIYVRWMVRLRRRGDAWPVHRTVAWIIGWALFAYTLNGAPGVYGKVSFRWHMMEHMSIAMLVPLFLVPAAPITLALRALPARLDRTIGPREAILGVTHSRYVSFFANPIIAAGIFFFSLAIFYFSPLFALAMTTHTGHVLMVVHFLMSGYFFVWMLVGIDPGPRKWHPVLLLVILFVTVAFHAFFGVVITQSETLMAPEFFGRLNLPWIPDPLVDQFKGGEIAWGVGEVPTLILAMMVAMQFVRHDEKDARRKDRQADRDSDAELEAYNAHLSGLRTK